ncbi:hypothetical protein GOODEAATRI_019923 [Goodea atripinnis]|uniref:Uncharacterized protein n=1 Tax=Goodea atripinnis TaxID=208336 RepID=A0ABV0N2V8_9TELE
MFHGHYDSLFRLCGQKPELGQHLVWRFPVHRLLWHPSLTGSPSQLHQTAFFRQHGCSTNDTNSKYNSRAAQMYREKIRQLANAALSKYGTQRWMASLNLSPTRHAHRSVLVSLICARKLSPWKRPGFLNTGVTMGTNPTRKEVPPMGADVTSACQSSFWGQALVACPIVRYLTHVSENRG